MVQVSINVTDYTVNPLHEVLDLVRKEASQRGVAVAETEIYGLVPAEALLAAASHCLQLAGFDASQVLDLRLLDIRPGIEHDSPLLFRNARIYTPVDEGRASSGSAQGKVAAWDKGALLCRDGRIAAIGDESSVLQALGARPSRVRLRKRSTAAAGA